MDDVEFEPDMGLEWAVGLDRQIVFTPADAARKGGFLRDVLKRFLRLFS